MKKFDALEKFFGSRKINLNDWKKYPIILRWMKTPSMSKSANIINNKVRYLLPRAKSKVAEWFSNDKALTQITAERYLLDYLRSKNKNFEENFKGNGVDAFLSIANEKVGIEVTTINECLSEWILHEKLLLYLSCNLYKSTVGIEIQYKLSDIIILTYKQEYELIEKIGQAILKGSYKKIDNIQLTKIRNKGSFISWNLDDDINNIVDYLESRLVEILDKKAPQLKKNERNILFICTNQIPAGSHYPEIIKEIAKPKRFKGEIRILIKKVKAILPKYVVGICFFEYSLEQEYPYYPLKIIWKSDSNKPDRINISY